MNEQKTEDYLPLPKNIVLNRNERTEMCRIIKSALRKIYEKPDYCTDIVNVSGKEINLKYLNRAVNNRYLLKKIVSDPRKEIVTQISSTQELFDFVRENISNLFHPDGTYFESVYTLLQSTTQKGEKNENIAFKFVENMARKRGLDIKVTKPKNVTDDIYLGIDGVFTHNNKNYTIQIKPLAQNFSPNIARYRNNDNYTITYCDGFIKEVMTDYLILIDTKTQQCFLYKTAGIIPGKSYFLIPVNNFVNTQT